MKHLVLVLSDPTEGQEDEYNRWYEDLHMKEMLSTTNWKSAQRFVLKDELWNKSAHNYLAVYEVEADDPKDVLRQLNATRAERQQSPSIDIDNTAVWVFSEIGPKHEGS